MSGIRDEYKLNEDETFPHTLWFLFLLPCLHAELFFLLHFCSQIAVATHLPLSTFTLNDVCLMRSYVRTTTAQILKERKLLLMCFCETNLK